MREIAAMAVVLFDIDGTLIKTGGAGGRALMEAFSEMFGVPHPQEVPFCGCTDRGIARNLFQLHGVDDTSSNWELLRSDYLRRLADYLPRCPGEVLPGVTELLEELAQRTHVATGLLTGNTREGAQMKLDYYGLGGHFPFGGFGDLHVGRDDVAHEALASSRAYLNDNLAPQQIWVIGDTPLDIQCARAIGARVAAVATGWHSVELLENAKPDLLLHDLQQAGLMLQQLG